MSKESEMIQNFLQEKNIALTSLEDDLNDVVCDEIADNDSKISNRITISSPRTDEQSTFGEEEIREYIYKYTQQFQ